MCGKCNDVGYLGFLNPDGFLAGEIRWTFLEFLIKRPCPKCDGKPETQLPPRPVPSSPPSPPRTKNDEFRTLLKMVYQPPGTVVDIQVQETIERDHLNRRSKIIRTETQTRIVDDRELANRK